MVLTYIVLSIYVFMNQSFLKIVLVNLAEWSKAIVSGTIPQGREFEPHN